MVDKSENTRFVSVSHISSMNLIIYASHFSLYRLNSHHILFAPLPPHLDHLMLPSGLNQHRKILLNQPPLHLLIRTRLTRHNRMLPMLPRPFRRIRIMSLNPLPMHALHLPPGPSMRPLGSIRMIRKLPIQRHPRARRQIQTGRLLSLVVSEADSDELAPVGDAEIQVVWGAAGTKGGFLELQDGGDCVLQRAEHGVRGVHFLPALLAGALGLPGLGCWGIGGARREVGHVEGGEGFAVCAAFDVGVCFWGCEACHLHGDGLEIGDIPVMHYRVAAEDKRVVIHIDNHACARSPNMCQHASGAGVCG